MCILKVISGYPPGHLPGHLPGVLSQSMVFLVCYLSQQTSDWHFATLYVNEDVEVYADGKDGFWM